jgi:NADPH:quinone reductase-like Zn-dependent oxidoreductase
VDASGLARMPVGLGFIEAGGMPVVAVTARSMLFDYGGLQRGQRVLVHGAAGAVGNLGYRRSADHQDLVRKAVIKKQPRGVPD